MPDTAINVTLMKDASEIVRYDEVGVPLYIRTSRLSYYTDMRALCHWHEDLEFIRVLEGEMLYSVNGKQILLTEGDSLFVNTRQMHYGCAHEGRECRFHCILLLPSLLTGHPLLYRRCVLPVLESAGLDYLHFSAGRPDGETAGCLLDDVAAAKAGRAPGYELRAIGLLAQLWGLVAERANAASGKPAGQELDLLRDMIAFVVARFSEKLTLEEIAAAGGVCRSRCCALFRRYAQESPIDFLNHYRLEVSLNLLRDTQKSITDIALACGFNHPSYYGKLFLQRYGCTPREYRKSQKAPAVDF